MALRKVEHDAHASSASGWDLPLGTVFGFLVSYALLFLGVFLAILLTACALALLNLMLLFLGEPIDLSEFVRTSSIFAAVYLLAVKLAMMLVSRSPVDRAWGVAGWVGAFGLLLAGSVAAARISDVQMPKSILAELNLWTLAGIAAMSLYAWLRRLLPRRLARRRHPFRWSFTFRVNGSPYQNHASAAATSDVTSPAAPPPYSTSLTT